MKKLLLLLSALPILCISQQTYVPDNNFEAYLEANGMGNGIANDDYVTTANINTVIYLDVNGQSIADLTGIEDFTALTVLFCFSNQLTSLDVSQNTALTYFQCHDNQLTCLNIKNGNNINLTLHTGQPSFNLNNLTCIEVDNPVYSTANEVKRNTLTISDCSYSEWIGDWEKQ